MERMYACETERRNTTRQKPKEGENAYPIYVTDSGHFLCSRGFEIFAVI